MEQAGPQLLRHWIDRAAARDPDKAFIVSADDGRTLTYGQLRELTGRIATYLRDKGIGANDRVALLSNNSIEHLAVYFGVLAYGATICTVHVEMNRNQLDNILPLLKPRMVLCEDGLGLDDMLKAVSAPCLPLGAWDDRRGDSFFAAVNALRAGRCRTPMPAPDDSAVILFTSGTSARPKGVVLSFRELLSNAGPTADGFDLTAQDRIYDFRSFNWCSAQTLSAVPPLCRGATLILGRKFSRSRFFDHIRQYGATIATGNPTTIGILLNGDAAGRAGTADAALHDVELGAAHGRRVAALRGSFRHSRLAGLRLQRDRLDRGAAGRAAPHRHGRPAARLSPPVHRRHAKGRC